MSDRKDTRSQVREIVGGLNRQWEATETASECGSDICSLKTASEIEMFYSCHFEINCYQTI